jgi:hypothetical protein
MCVTCSELGCTINYNEQSDLCKQIANDLKFLISWIGLGSPLKDVSVEDEKHLPVSERGLYIFRWKL